MDTDTLYQHGIDEQQEAERKQDAGETRRSTPPRRALGLLKWVGISLVAGLLGSLAAIVIMGILRLTVGAPTLPELLAERILLTLNANEFVSLLVRFAPNSKTEPLFLTLLGQFFVGMLLGPVLHLAIGRRNGQRGRWPGRRAFGGGRLREPGSRILASFAGSRARAWITAAGFVVVMEAVAIGLFWPVLGAGLVGDPPDRARVITSLCMLATFVGFVGVTLLADHWLHRAWLPRNAGQSLQPIASDGPAGSRRYKEGDARLDGPPASAGPAGSRRYEKGISPNLPAFAQASDEPAGSRRYGNAAESRQREEGDDGPAGSRRYRKEIAGPDAPSASDGPAISRRHEKDISPNLPAFAQASDEPAGSRRYEDESGSHVISRRAALGAAGVTVLAVAAAGAGIDRLIAGYLARSNLSYEGMGTVGLTSIIPADNFYVVSKNVLDPQVSLGRWELQVQGLVGQARVWSYEQVKALPSETRAVTLECIANGPGGHLMGNANWTGVLVKTVLDEAGGAQSNAQYVTFTSVDGYQYNQSLTNLLEARALLAWDMNGEPLPERHGYPLRLIMPGRYGEQSVKWLTRIEVVDQPYNGGLYQSQGWSSAPLETTSRIDQPAFKSKVPLGPVQMVGIAFAGIRGIQQVEISTDNGMTWNTATLMPPLSDQSWVLWNWTWNPSARGAYTLIVRATDGTGALQTETPRGTVPNGATGYQHLPVQIV